MLPKYVLLGFLLVFGTLTSCFRENSKTTTQDKEIPKSNSFKSKNFKLKSVDDLYQFLTYEEGRYPLVSAHRGGTAHGYPENAIETFSYFANKMPLIIECDIRLSKDSVMVLMHDETLDRTSNGKGNIADFTLSELKNFKLKDDEGNITNFRIPTLEEALVWGNGNVIYTLDVKQDVSYEKLSQLINKVSAQPYVVIITYNTRQARAMHNINPDLMLSVSIKSTKDLTALADTGIPDTKVVAFIGTAHPKKDLVDRIHQHGIKTILGTIGNLDRQADSKGYQVYAEYVDNGADILSTDRPLEAQKALDFYIRKRNINSPYINN